MQCPFCNGENLKLKNIDYNFNDISLDIICIVCGTEIIIPYRDDDKIKEFREYFLKEV